MYGIGAFQLYTLFEIPGTEMTTAPTDIITRSLRSLGPKWMRTEVTKDRSGCRPVPVTGTLSRRFAYRHSLWLADLWHAYWTAGSKPTNQNGVDVQALNNLAIGFPLFWT